MLCAMTWRRGWAVVLGAALVGPAVMRVTSGEVSAQAARPNIVLMFPDNLGWGEVGAYGSVRGHVTPRLDRLASEGIRLNNFNVEFSCTVSRAALMTGRYAIRTGATQAGGITLWEVTIAESLKAIGYATALFGKWHLGGDGPEGKREPSHQGFDEFYGIPRTSNEAQTTIAQGQKTPNTSFIWEGAAGQPSRNVKPFNQETRRLIDRESADRSVAFMEKNAKARTPFFVYYPITQIHFPTLPHPDFAGKTGAGDIGDAMAEMDANVGRVLDALDRLKIAPNTIVLWCTDNGAEQRRPWRGSSGPWSGFYNTRDGGRHPDAVHHSMAGPNSRRARLERDRPRNRSLPDARGRHRRRVPADRAIDGVNQLPFLEGKQPKSNRESVLFFTNADVRAVKWHDWKFHYTYQPEAGAPPVPPLMRLFNLLSDPKEETDIKDGNPWAQGVMDKLVGRLQGDDGAVSACAAERTRSLRSRRSGSVYFFR